MMASALVAPPRDSGPYTWVWTTFLPSRMAASARMIPARMTPWPPSPLIRTSYLIGVSDALASTFPSRPSRVPASQRPSFQALRPSLRFRNDPIIGFGVLWARRLVDHPGRQRRLCQRLEHFGRRPPGDKGSARGLHQAAGIEVRLDVAVRRRGGKEGLRRGRGQLPPRHPVDLVVEEEAGEIDIPPRRMDQGVAGECAAVSLSGDDHYGA